MNISALPIAVFDSGVGGLTVLRALKAHLPNESFLYLGDMARLPYGTKSPETITRYALNAAHFLLSQNIKLLVIACHTATSLALTALEQNFVNLPIVGVLEPGVYAACTNTRNNHIAIIATEATVKAEAYQKAIVKLKSEAQVVAKGCSLFVALAEEGWVEGIIAEEVAKQYLSPIFSAVDKPDCLLLGCTHFPPLATTIQKIVGKDVRIIDPAIETARRVKQVLQRQGLLNGESRTSSTRFMVTDSPDRFTKIAAQFLETEIHSAQVRLVDTQLHPLSEPEDETI